jgi:hypothetical protein
MKIHSWADEETGGEKLIIWLEGQAGGPPHVFSLLTGVMRRLDFGERTPEEFIIRIPWNIFPQFKRAMAEWLSGEDIRPADESRAQGKLEATRYHLEDLREILKLHAPHGKESK